MNYDKLWDIQTIDITFNSEAKNEKKISQRIPDYRH